MRKFLSIAVLWACAFHVSANPLQVDVMLSSMKAIKSQEAGGDEVYFSVTQYSNKKRPQESRIPMFPTYWRSATVNELKDVILWHAELEQGESVQVVLSLIEHDAPPWNVDDHLGSAKVTLNNDRGRMKVEWSQPNYQDQPPTIQSPEAPLYTFMAGEAKYQVKFDIKKLR